MAAIPTKGSWQTIDLQKTGSYSKIAIETSGYDFKFKTKFADN